MGSRVGDGSKGCFKAPAGREVVVDGESYNVAFWRGNSSNPAVGARTELDNSSPSCVRLVCLPCGKHLRIVLDVGVNAVCVLTMSLGVVSNVVLVIVLVEIVVGVKH